VHAVPGAVGIWPGKAADRGADGDRAGADDQLVVADEFLGSAGGAEQQLAGRDVDPAGR
jgi:hypothetical protein